jgi:hypothetical protein
LISCLLFFRVGIVKTDADMNSNHVCASYKVNFY